MKRLSWKYIAGLIDGEGCIDMQIMKNKRHSNDSFYCRPRVRMAMAENAYFILEILKANHGGSIQKRNLNKTNPNWQDSYSWEMAGKKDVRPFLQNIVNHMEIKKEQAKLAIWVLDHLSGKTLPKGVKQVLREEMKAMKRDPQRLSESVVRNLQKGISGEWSKWSNACLGCGRSDVRHEAKGYCKPCYDKIKWQNKKTNQCDSLAEPTSKAA